MASATATTSWLLVQAGGHRLGLPVPLVREVVPGPERYTRLPGAGAHAAGLLNLRGQLVTVLDLGVLVEGAPAARGEHGVVVLEVDGRTVGLAVEAVHRMTAAEVEDAEPLRAFGLQGAHVAGVGAAPDGVFVALAPEVWARRLLVGPRTEEGHEPDRSDLR